MSKTFRPWKIEEPLLLPVTVADFVAESHLARFVLSVVRDEVDLGKITGTYGSALGQPPFNPIMMTALLLYAYCSGIYSSRRIAKACGERVDFMSIVGLDVPDFRTLGAALTSAGQKVAVVDFDIGLAAVEVVLPTPPLPDSTATTFPMAPSSIWISPIASITLHEFQPTPAVIQQSQPGGIRRRRLRVEKECHS
jgi:transposase